MLKQRIVDRKQRQTHPSLDPSEATRNLLLTSFSPTQDLYTFLEFLASSSASLELKNSRQVVVKQQSLTLVSAMTKPSFWQTSPGGSCPRVYVREPAFLPESPRDCAIAQSSCSPSRSNTASEGRGLEVCQAVVSAAHSSSAFRQF